MNLEGESGMSFIQESVVGKIKQMKESDPEFRRAFFAAEQEREIVSKIIKARKKMGLTQKDFALRLGLKQQAISTFERVEESPTLKKLVQLAGALDMEIRVVKKRKIPVRGFRVHRECMNRDKERQECFIHDYRK